MTDSFPADDLPPEWEGLVESVETRSPPSSGAASDYFIRNEFTILAEAHLYPRVSDLYASRKIGAWMPISNEALQDVPQLQSFINYRLGHQLDMFVRPWVYETSIRFPDSWVLFPRLERWNRRLIAIRDRLRYYRRNWPPRLRLEWEQHVCDW